MGLLDGTTQQAYYQGNDHGNYQFTSLTDIINQFMTVYVGEDKIISKAKRLDVAFHAQRALAELSFDTFKSVKAQEITLPPSLQMTLPHDYVNYTKVSWVDSAGIKHLMYPTSKTSNPSNPTQDASGNFKILAKATITSGSDEIVLDAQYNNILVGMKVGLGASGGIDNAIILAVTHASSITTLKLSATATATFPSFYGIEIEVTNGDGSLNLLPEEQFTVESATFSSAAVNKIEVPFADKDKIKAGMLVSSEHLPAGTVVESVAQGNYSGANPVFISNPHTALGLTSGSVTFTSQESISDTWSSYKSGQSHEANHNASHHHHYDHDHEMLNRRYGLDPQHAQANGSFYIDDNTGKIHFSSNISGKTVILDYISDSLGTDGEMQVHKFAEEAMYKWISHAILSGRANVPEYQVNRFKKERFAAIRTAKLRLSNIKIEELTQILRGKSKWIKH